MMAEVPKADLVVTNPTHYAVALKYDDNDMRAPRVVAKGADLVALRIRDIAASNKVAVLEAPPLARALYAHPSSTTRFPPASTPRSRRCWPRSTSSRWKGEGGDAPRTPERPAEFPEALEYTVKSRMNALASLMRPPTQLFSGIAVQGTGRAAPHHHDPGMMVLPLPPFLLDLLFTFNIALSLMVLLVACTP